MSRLLALNPASKLASGAAFPAINPGTTEPLFQVQPSVAARGPLGEFYGEPLFNGAVVDPSIVFGYNMNAGGTLSLAGEPGAGFVVEGYYDDLSGQIKMEAYLQFLDVALTYARPLFTQYNRTTKSIVLELGGSTIPLVTFKSANLNFTPGGSGATVHLVGFAMNGGANVMYLFDQPLGAAGAAISVGIQDNGAIGTFAVGSSDVSIKGLVVRGKALQTANLFEAQDENSAAHIYITAGHSTKPASLVVGKAVLANAATDGFLYLPTMAGTPTSAPPTARVGTVPFVYDTTAQKLWVYSGAWRGVVVA